MTTRFPETHIDPHRMATAKDVVSYVASWVLKRTDRWTQSCNVLRPQTTEENALFVATSPSNIGPSIKESCKHDVGGLVSFQRTYCLRRSLGFGQVSSGEFLLRSSSFSPAFAAGIVRLEPKTRTSELKLSGRGLPKTTNKVTSIRRKSTTNAITSATLQSALTSQFAR